MKIKIKGDYVRAIVPCVITGASVFPWGGEDEWLGDNIFYLFIQFPLMNKNLRRGSDQRIRVSPHHTTTLTLCPPTPIPSEKQIKQIFDFDTRSFSPLIFDPGVILSFLHVCFFLFFCFFQEMAMTSMVARHAADAQHLPCCFLFCTFSHSPAQVQPRLESSLKWDPFRCDIWESYLCAGVGLGAGSQLHHRCWRWRGPPLPSPPPPLHWSQLCAALSPSPLHSPLVSDPSHRFTSLLSHCQVTQPCRTPTLPPPP